MANLPILTLIAIFSSVALADVVETPTLKNESEAGVVITTGNSRAQSFNLKHQSEYVWSANLLKGTARYLNTSSNGVESARTWGLGLRYERSLSEKFSLFVGQSVESDVFAGYLQRYNTDLGAKYSIIKEKDLAWVAEGGYRYSRENRVTPPDLNQSLLRFYTEANKAWNESFSTKLWIEYLPNLTTSADWQLNSELSIAAVLTSIFSLKTAYLVKYDGLPASGAQSTDTVFTTALVAKY